MVVSGDVYDRALPHVDAVALADDAFARLAHSRASVVVSSGNHDSAQRLGFGSRLMDAAGVFVRTSAAGVGTPVVLGDEHGDVAVHALPYLDPSALLRALEPAPPQPRGSAGRGDDPGPLGPGRPRSRAPGRSCSRTRSSPGRRRPSPSATSASAGSHGWRPSSSTGSTTPRWDTSTGPTCWATPCATAGRRWPTPSPRPTRSRVPGWWSWAPTASPAPTGSTPRSRAGSRASAGRSTSSSTIRGTRSTRTTGSRPRSPTLLGRCARWSSCVGASPARWSCSSLRLPADAHTPVARRAGRSDHDIALDFISDLRGVPATPQESALLGEAVDACCHDPDQDVLAG